MSPGPLVIVGDTLCDMDVSGTVSRHCPDAASAPVLDAERADRRPGGAGLAALLAAAAGVPVRLVTALADDDEGDWLAAVLGERIELVAGPADGPTCLKVRMLDRGRPLVRVDHGLGRAGEVEPAMLDALLGAGAVLVADYGRGVCGTPAMAHALASVSRDVPVIWDPHPRGGAPVPGCAMVTPNLAEARRALDGHRLADGPVEAAPAAARALSALWSARAVAVTVGAHGAALAAEGIEPRLLPADAAPPEADPCGAGDCFATSVADALRCGASPVTAVSIGVERASDFVRAGGATAVRLDRTPARSSASSSASSSARTPARSSARIPRVAHGAEALTTTGRTP